MDLQAQLEKSKRMEVVLLECENTLKEAITEGNEDEVRQLQRQIDSLKQLIKDQNELLLEAARGEAIDDIAYRVNHCQVQGDPKPQRRPTTCLDCFNQIWGSCFTLRS